MMTGAGAYHGLVPASSNQPSTASSIRRVHLHLPLVGLDRPRRIDFISDLHIRTADDLERFKAASSDPGSDVLLLGGDYVEKRRYLKPLFDHILRTYDRVFAVFGNNDHVSRVRLAAIARRPRIRFLFDEVVDLDGVHLLGTRDPARDHPVLPELPRDPLLVLSHSPDILLLLPPRRSLLLLAGHVHGGQFRIPFWPFWWSHTRIGRTHGEGRSRRGRNEIFVGRGIGCSLLTLRNVPQEIYTITLAPDEQNGAA